MICQKMYSSYMFFRIGYITIPNPMSYLNSQLTCISTRMYVYVIHYTGILRVIASDVRKLTSLIVKVSDIKTTSLVVKWEFLSTSKTVSTYSISYSNTNNTQCFTDSNDISDISASETMYNLTGLQEATEYSITVTAILSDGETVEDILTATTLPDG